MYLIILDNLWMLYGPVVHKNVSNLEDERKLKQNKIKGKNWKGWEKSQQNLKNVSKFGALSRFLSWLFPISHESLLTWEILFVFYPLLYTT